METDRGVLLVGGPDMGKTNFLARLWGAVYKSKTGILRYDGLPDDRLGREVQATRLTTRQREILVRLGFPTPAKLLSQRLPRAPT